MKDNIKTDKVFSSLFWVFTENISSQVASFLVTIVLARLLSPNDYGTIALICVFTGIAQVFVVSGIGISLIQKKDADELDYSSMFWFNLAVSVILYLILFFASPFIADYYNNKSLSLVLRVLALSIPINAFNCIQQAYVTSRMIFRKSFYANFCSVFVSGTVGIVMAFWGYGIWALVFQRLLMDVVSTIVLKILIPWYPRLIFSYKRLIPLLNFGWKVLATSLMFTAYNQIRSLIIGKRFSADDLGYYDRGNSFPNLIASNIDSTINRVLFPALSHEQDNQELLAVKTRRSVKTSLLLMVPLLCLLALTANSIVYVLLGSKWLPCVPFFQIMCLAWCFQPTQSCCSQAIKAIGRSDISLYVEIISKVIGVGILIYAVLAIDTVLAIAFSTLVSQFIALFLYGYVNNKYIGYKARYQIIDFLIPMTISIVVCCLVYFLGLFIDSHLMRVILQLLIGAALYFLFSYIFKVESFYYLLNILKAHLKKPNTAV